MNQAQVADLKTKFRRTFPVNGPGHHWWVVWVVALLTLAGLKLRLNGYTQTPAPTDNTDELAWAWSGLTLITKHVPYAWSDFWSTYGHWQGFTYNKVGYTVVHPWLDHPPLFSLVIGGWSWLTGAKDLGDVTLSNIRLPAVFLSASTVPLTFMLGRRLMGIMPALVATLILTVAPVEVLLSHTVESEALLAPLFLLTLLLLHYIIKGEGGRKAIVGLLICCALAPLVKVPGIALCITVAAILVSRGRWRLGLGAIGAGVLGLALFVAYGALMNWSLFWAVQLHQSSRHLGLSSVFTYIGGAVGINAPLHDGWWLLGFIALGAFLLRKSDDEAMFLGWPVVIYALMMMIMADPQLVGQYGWYRIAIYPLVYLMAGLLVWRSIKAPSVAGVALIIAVAGGVATIGLGKGHADFTPSLPIVLGFLFIILTPSLLTTWLKNDRLRLAAQILSGVAIALIVIANLAQSLMLHDLFRSL